MNSRNNGIAAVRDHRDCIIDSISHKDLALGRVICDSIGFVPNRQGYDGILSTYKRDGQSGCKNQEAQDEETVRPQVMAVA
jgi:hypothetical protein